MGIKYAPSIANLYMGDYDETFNLESGRLLTFYRRFLDDLFGVWTGTKEELTQLFNKLNFLIPGIEVTPTIHETFVNFLDMYIYKTKLNNKTYLDTGIYFKETASHQLLDCSSFHPAHTTRGIIKGQLTRFARLTSLRLEYSLACELTFSHLVKRGYKRKVFNYIKNEVWANKNKRQILNQPDNNKNNKNHICIILPYAKFTHNLGQKWKRLLANSEKFKEFDINLAFRKNKNLSQILCRSDILKLDPGRRSESIFNLILALGD